MTYEKKFDLEAAKSGARIFDEHGNEWKLIAYVPEAVEYAQVILLQITNKVVSVRPKDGIGDPQVYTEPIQTIERWVAVFAGKFNYTAEYFVYNSKEIADMLHATTNQSYVGAFKIEIPVK